MRKIAFLLILVILASAAAALASCVPETFKATVYEMEIALDTVSMEADISMNVDYTNNSEDTLNNLVFHLYPDAYSEEAAALPVAERLVESAYYGGINYGGIDILRVEDSEGASLSYTEADQLLNITIPELKPGKDISVFVRYTLDIPKMKNRFGYTEHTLNLGNFYPIAAVYQDGAFRTDGYVCIGDPFYSDIADYDVTLKMDKDYTAAVTGEILSETVNVDTKTLEIKAENVRDFAMAISDEYTVLSAAADSCTVNYYYYADLSPESSLEAAVNALNAFEAMIGDYPYSVYNVAETDMITAGMEYPELVFVSSLLTSASVREQTIVHETAHQWWYGLVGSDEISSAWMDEGLTEFCVALYYESVNGGALKSEITSSFNAYMLYNDALITLSAGDTSINRSLNEFASDYEYSAIVYDKGMLMFNTVYEILGEDDFKAAMQSYYKDNLYKNATEESIISAFSSRNSYLDRVFDAWLNGKVVFSSLK